jgi:glycosyltransferase involved in cell wall biosynthesis
MKIGLLVPGGVDRSGEVRVVPALLALISRLSAGHEVHVFALHQEETPDEWDLLGARVHNIGTHDTRRRALGAIRAEHRAGRLQVIQSIWSGTPGLLATLAGRLLGIPAFVHVAGGELVALPDIAYGGRLAWKGRLREAVVLRAATCVTAASGAMTEALARLGIAARRLPLGADLQIWPPRAPVGRDVNRPARLIHVASLNRIKDQETLLRALTLLLDAGIEFELDVVGEDTLGGEVQSLTRRLGLETRVRFHGFLTQRQLRPLMSEADILLVSSRHEAGPLVVLEAAACGVPTVGTAVGHIAEWAPAAAVSVAIKDPQALAQATARLLADESLRLRVAREAWNRALQEDADFTARAFQSMYRDFVL